MMTTKNVLTAVFIAVAGVTSLTACSETGHSRTAGQVIDDTTITARVKKALIEDEQVKAREINVDTYNGVVQLSGFVDTRNAVGRAEDLAKAVPGVVSVKNDLRVKPQG